MATKSNPLTFLVGDQGSEALYLLHDRNGDGDTADVGEVGVFFDGHNAAGLADPLASVLDTFQGKDGSVYAGDNGTDSVYRLYDRNGDGDATDAGEAWAWFSAAGNAGGHSLVTPNGIAGDDDGNIYIVTPGVLSGESRDLIYKTTDHNGDGDAQDAGEAGIWLDLQTINPNSSAFEISFDGDVAYVTDTNGRDPDTIYRIEDKDRSGDIQADEVSVFIADGNPFGVNPDFAHDIHDGSVYAFEFTGGGDNRVWRLTDLDGSGSIDQAGEVQQIWNAGLLPQGYAASAGPGMDVLEDGSILLALNGGQPTQDSVVHLVDGNGDGDFQDEGETRVLVSRADGAAWLDRPRPVEEYQASSGRHEPAARGTEHDDRWVGGKSADKWSGSGGNDEARSGGGSDKIYGDGGNDVLFGQDGDDHLFGGADQDLLDGGNGQDRLYGGAGDDRLAGGAGNDRLDGEDGEDHLAGDAGADQLFGGFGNDILEGGTGDDHLYGQEGNDTIRGGAGNDVARGAEGDDLVDGGAGDDFVYGADGNDRVQGGAGDDQVRGDAGDDVLSGDAGDDRVYGGSGDDILYAGSGADQLYGHEGDDILVLDVLDPGAGQDLFNGGSGEDVLELHLSARVANSGAFQAELDRFEEVIDPGTNYSFEFRSLGLVVQNIESYELVVG
ncbi:hypothetical protein [Geminicoccus roseus]|uniref:hypothetical protein n=1 Tax=Geminicoccus roseus TaxID=404900 RepID=UPI000418BF3D|nr:hypothetical protein [Geminicoccus roseus]